MLDELIPWRPAAYKSMEVYLKSTEIIPSDFPHSPATPTRDSEHMT